MLAGICPKCKSRDQRFYDRDGWAKGRRLVCFTCGFVTHWVSFNGRIYKPPPWVPDWKLTYHPASMAKGG